jgi:hypothetical protein
VLEGGVRKHGDTVRIDVQLVNATDGFQVWADTFERRLGDIFQLQTEVACAVLTAVLAAARLQRRPRTSHAGDPGFRRVTTSSARPSSFPQRNTAALQRAVECFEQAIERDPSTRSHAPASPMPACS